MSHHSHSTEDDISDTEPNLDWWDGRLPNIHGTDDVPSTREAHHARKRQKISSRERNAHQIAARAPSPPARRALANGPDSGVHEVQHALKSKESSERERNVYQTAARALPPPVRRVLADDINSGVHEAYHAPKPRSSAERDGDTHQIAARALPTPARIALANHTDLDVHEAYHAPKSRESVERDRNNYHIAAHAPLLLARRALAHDIDSSVREAHHTPRYTTTVTKETNQNMKDEYTSPLSTRRAIADDTISSTREAQHTSKRRKMARNETTGNMQDEHTSPFPAHSGLAYDTSLNARDAHHAAKRRKITTNEIDRDTIAARAPPLLARGSDDYDFETQETMPSQIADHETNVNDYTVPFPHDIREAQQAAERRAMATNETNQDTIAARAPPPLARGGDDYQSETQYFSYETMPSQSADHESNESNHTVPFRHGIREAQQAAERRTTATNETTENTRVARTLPPHTRGALAHESEGEYLSHRIMPSQSGTYQDSVNECFSYATMPSQSGPDQESDESDDTVRYRDGAMVRTANGGPEVEHEPHHQDALNRNFADMLGPSILTLPKKDLPPPPLNRHVGRPHTDSDSVDHDVSQPEQSLRVPDQQQHNDSFENVQGSAELQDNGSDQYMGDEGSSYQPSDDMSDFTRTNARPSSVSQLQDPSTSNDTVQAESGDMLDQDSESPMMPPPQEMLDYRPEHEMISRKSRYVSPDDSGQLPVDPEYMDILNRAFGPPKAAPVKRELSSYPVDADYLRILKRHENTPPNVIEKRPEPARSAEADALSQRYREEMMEAQRLGKQQTPTTKSIAQNKRKNTTKGKSRAETRGHMEARIQQQRNTGASTSTQAHFPDTFVLEPSDFPLLNLGVQTCPGEPAIRIKVARRMPVGDILEMALQDDEILRNNVFMISDRFVHFKDTPAELGLQDGDCFEMRALPREWLPVWRLGQEPGAEVQSVEPFIPENETDLEGLEESRGSERAWTPGEEDVE